MWYTIDIITLPSPSEVYYEVYIYIYTSRHGMMYQMESHRPFSVGQELSQSCSWRCVCFFPPCLVALPVLTILPVDALDLYLYMYIYIYTYIEYIYSIHSMPTKNSCWPTSNSFWPTFHVWRSNYFDFKSVWYSPYWKLK